MPEIVGWIVCWMFMYG